MWPVRRAQVVTQLLDMKIDRSTMLNNVRHHQAVWSRFPPGSYVSGITYDFIRIFFETWEEYRCAGSVATRSPPPARGAQAL